MNLSAVKKTSFYHKLNTFTVTRKNVKKIPFVELFNDRLQGVVSSGSDIERVYVSFIESGTFNYYCSTNNNRPCGGLNSYYPCNHIQGLLEEAINSYGVEAVAKYLKVSNHAEQIPDIRKVLIESGHVQKEPASEVFSRFLNYLRYLELESSSLPIPEMNWFI